jgi:hypothetical protein
MAKVAFNKEALFTSKWLKFKEETSKVLHLEHSFICCWIRMEKISWTVPVINRKYRVKEMRNILHTTKGR